MSILDGLSNRQSELILNSPNRAEILKAGPPRNAQSNVLGKGSYGTVFKAIFQGKDVAVKVIKNANAIHLQAIKNEAHILGWHHRNIVQIMKVESTPNFGIVIMERFLGRSLNIILDKIELSLHHRINVSLDVLAALSYCHKRKLLHLDVKPQNIYVTFISDKLTTSFTNTQRLYICKLCDFGSSLLLNEQNHLKYCSIRGTIRYMPPEMIRGAILTPSSDIYSLGITMWQMSQRRLPYYWIECNETVAYQVTKYNLRPDALINLTEKPQHISRTYKNILKQLSMQLPCNDCRELQLTKRYPLSVGNLTNKFHSIEKFGCDIKWISTIFACSPNYDQNVNKEISYKEIYQSCWLNEPSSRPNLQQLFASLKRLC